MDKYGRRDAVGRVLVACIRYNTIFYIIYIYTYILRTQIRTDRSTDFYYYHYYYPRDKYVRFIIIFIASVKILADVFASAVGTGARARFRCIKHGYYFYTPITYVHGVRLTIFFSTDNSTPDNTS